MIFMPFQGKMNRPIVPKKNIGSIATGRNTLFRVIRKRTKQTRKEILDGAQALNTSHSINLTFLIPRKKYVLLTVTSKSKIARTIPVISSFFDISMMVSIN
jgi:hypothetical protein